MSRAFSIGRVFGIRLDVHASWFLIYAFVVLTIANAPPANGFARPLGYALAAVAGLALFASVVLHELAHALAARRFGVATRSIALFVLGGVATLEHEPPTPLADAAVALAGPAISAAIAGAAYGALHAVPALVPIVDRPVAVALCAYVTVANAMLAGFNLIPAYPMDGGRALRAGIWRLRGDRDGATASAALVGIALAGLFAVAGAIAAFTTRTWQFGWYVVLAGFLMRQSIRQYRALRGAAALPLAIEVEAPMRSASAA